MPLAREEQTLIDTAIAVRERSYAPYSQFRVGAAVRLRDGRVFSGTNVENVSFGLTVCAERHAVAAAVAGGAKPGDIVAVAVVGDAEGPTPPCGACRQVLTEFAPPETIVLMHNLRDGSTARQSMHDLLPNAFLSYTN